jgi:hypothetical protein
LETLDEIKKGESEMVRFFIFLNKYINFIPILGRELRWLISVW